MSPTILYLDTIPGDPIMSLALRIAEEERCDAILALQDNFVEPLDRTLVRRYGSSEVAARRYFVGKRPDIVAAECGYSSTDDFRRAFRQRMGMTPRKWALGPRV